MLARMNAKQGIWLIWIGSLGMIFLGSGWVATVGHVAFWLTLGAHVVECIVHLDLFRRAGGPLVHHIVQTLIYGLFHWRPIQERLAADESPGAEAP